MAHLSKIPARVIERLGVAPADLGRFGSSRVLRGNGVVLKAGPVDRTAREVFVRAEVSELPLAVPSVLEAGDSWLLLEELESAEPVTGTARDGALADLARLHDTFEEAPLLHDPRLRDVTGRELPLLRERSLRLAQELELPDVLRTFAARPDDLLQRLDGRRTLVHGDAWPGNVLERRDGGRYWIDWEEAGSGHAAIDVANWCYGSPWVPPPANPDRDLANYLSARSRPVRPEVFRRSVDAAVVLLFLLLDLPGLPDVGAEHARSIIERRAETARRLG